MRSAFWLLALAAVAVAAPGDEPWVEEEDLEEPYNEEPEESHDRRRRAAYVERPDEEHVRVKRREAPEYNRVPRQVHQYEVHEATDEGSLPSPPYEQMLAASAEHYHRVYAAPGAPASARYLRLDAGAPVPPVSNAQFASASPVSGPVSVAVAPAQSSVPVFNDAVHFVAPVSAAAELSEAGPARALLGPTPVRAEPPTPLQRLAGGDLTGSAAGLHHQHAHAHAAGGGRSKHGGHHAHHGGKTTKGYASHHHQDKGGKGFKTDENHRKEYEEAAGKKKKHHDHAGHKGGHEEEAHGHRGAHFDEKKGHKKGHKTKGYHNKYHKDEFHKEHKFYDDFHKSGEHHRYGKFHAKHASNESGKKKAHHVNAGHDFVEKGKKGYSNKGHVDADHKGYKGKHGHEEHHENHSEHGKKGGSAGGKQWAHGKKN